MKEFTIKLTDEEVAILREILDNGDDQATIEDAIVCGILEQILAT